MVEVRVVDGAGALRAWVNTRPGLTGKGNPLPNGVHLSEVRAPASGPIASCVEIAPRDVDEAWDDVRLSFAVKSVGSEEGARRSAEAAARALANAVTTGLRGNPAVVTLPSGDVVRVLIAHSPQGPTMTGNVGGQVTYTFDATFRCQPA